MTHVYIHGYTKDIQGKYTVYLNPEKTKSFPVVKKKKSSIDKIKKAFRDEIYPQIKSFRRENNRLLQTGYYCPITGKKIVSWKQAHVDHVYPFHQLLKDFLISNKQTLDSVALDRKRQIKNRELADSWCQWHQQKAKLGILSIEANMAKSGTTNSSNPKLVSYMEKHGI